MSSDTSVLDRAIRRRLEQAIDERVTPGAAVAVGSSHGVDLEVCVGSFTYDAAEPVVTRDTLWDLASVTKVIIGVSLCGLAIERSALRLDAAVAEFHPAFAGERWRGTTVAHLLTHSAGQPAWRPWYLDAVDRDQVRREIASLPAEHEAGSVTLYSDLDFLVLWDVLEAAWGCPLEALSSDEVLLPLGMASACFLPGQQGLAHVCAPTELCAWRGRIIQGEVHDENAAALGGVAPHAGLFSSLADVEAFMSEILAAHAGRSGWMQQTTARRLTTRTGPSSSTFALGWATPVDGVGTRGGPLDLPHRLSGAGRLLSDTSFGHTGFTGTSVVADTTIDTWLAVLTNRVHPSRHGTGAPELRAALADLVATHRRA